jgi:hypothetical protein
VRSVIAWILVVLLAVPALGRERTPEEQARRISPGTEIEVTLGTGELLRGRMGSISSAGFVIEILKRNQGTSRTVALSEVRIIRARQHFARTAVVFFAIIAIVVAVAVFRQSSS